LRVLGRGSYSGNCEEGSRQREGEIGVEFHRVITRLSALAERLAAIRAAVT
jgi:hypothetical protein